jgi:hypothetical protein
MAAPNADIFSDIMQGITAQNRRKKPICRADRLTERVRPPYCKAGSFAVYRSIAGTTRHSPVLSHSRAAATQHRPSERVFPKRSMSCIGRSSLFATGPLETISATMISNLLFAPNPPAESAASSRRAPAIGPSGSGAR